MSLLIELIIRTYEWSKSIEMSKTFRRHRNAISLLSGEENILPYPDYKKRKKSDS